jgi:predicted TIM-barrel fold metal-dependent hydrolase
MIPIIDMWAPLVPSRETIDHVGANFPPEQLQYLEVFTKTEVTSEQFAEYAETLVRTDQQILADLEEAGIMRSLITGFDEKSTSARGKTFVPNEVVAAVAERHPDRFIPFAGADIMRGNAALADLEHWIIERGFVA